jgi:polyvinyl alcohol dehydrogenase (cytochrome)
MRGQAANLPDPERRQISEYLSGKAMREPHGSPHKLCIASGKWFDKSKRPVGNGWGIDYENTRLIPAQQAGFAAADAKNLRLKWAFAFPGVSSVLAQPLVAGGAVFIGSQDGTVYALDAQSGCLHWTLKAAASILGSIVMEEKESGSPRLYFSDRLAYAYAVDAIAGVLVWSKKIDDHPSATTMGTPVLAAGRLFVPIISLEENAGGAEYSCCTFRGSLIALDAATGDKIWQRYAIPSPAVEQFKNALGVPQFAPSGAGLWSSPAIDGKRGSIYFATGNSYSEPADENSNAVFAIDLESGDVKWRIQTLSDDSWTSWDYACRKNSGGKSLPGCPAIKNPGPDLDFTTSPVLVYGKNGKDILVVGRKDGTVFGLDPNSGWIVWSKRTSKNPDPNAGALYFGLMAEGERIFVPSVGTSFPNGGDFIPTADDGLYALHAFTGKRLWAARVTENCDKPTPCTGLSFAPIGIPGAVFAGATDGYVRAYDTKTGKVLWRFDTAQQFQTINGEMATGGAIGRSSIMVANRTVYVGSGYSKLPGNVLLAFSID